MKYLLLVVSVLLTFVAVAFGQGEVSDIVPVIEEGGPFSELSTISGIVAATLVVVEAIKRSTAKIAGIAAVPIWVLSIVVAVVLTWLANAMFKTLEGDLVALMWRAALTAASASGFYTWLRKPTEGPAKAME